MNNIGAKEKFKKEKNVIYICEIKYLGKKYAKTIRMQKEGIEYIYYEIDNDKIRDVEDKDIIQYLKGNYEGENTDIIY